jgi:hypothetical protein
MDAITNIVVVEGGNDSFIAKIFQGSPIPLSTTKDPNEADRITSGMNKPLVFVELDDESIGSREMLEQLMKSVNLPLFQLILLGKKKANSDLKEQLKNVYRDLKFLEFDRKNDAADDIAKLIKKSFDEIYPDQENTEAIEERTDEELAEATLPWKDSGNTEEVLNPIERETIVPIHNLPEHARTHKKRQLNGDTYIQVKDPAALLEKDYLPERAAYRKAIEKLEEECTNWERSHFHRTAFATYNILQSLNIERSFVDTARAASMLYFFPTGISSEKLTRSRYIRGTQSIIKKTMIKSFRANAASFNEQNDLREIAPIIEKIANIFDIERSISNPSSSNEQNVSKIASAIILTDLVARECWHDSYWDSTPTYAIVRWIESSEGKNLDNDVIWEFMRFLVETLEATPPEHVVTKEKRKNLQQTAPAKGNQTNSESKLKISQLAPGMRLAKPLLTFDGKRVLDHDIYLDNNLIWRIWRLSSMYPLEPALIAAP